ncbi:MAG: hypothetical protein HY210_06095 [Candidatus Omnitrophica bacterium]|nr:hypothetical protein [Candidatus Omnitrophota bacterium]MBI5024212.1 hypothetical protein [Candidatus Omnitrophota bacterium]
MKKILNSSVKTNTCQVSQNRLQFLKAALSSMDFRPVADGNPPEGRRAKPSRKKYQVP